MNKNKKKQFFLSKQKIKSYFDCDNFFTMNLRVCKKKMKLKYEEYSSVALIEKWKLNP